MHINKNLDGFYAYSIEIQHIIVLKFLILFQCISIVSQFKFNKSNHFMRKYEKCIETLLNCIKHYQYSIKLRIKMHQFYIKKILKPRTYIENAMKEIYILSKYVSKCIALGIKKHKFINPLIENDSKMS